MVQPALEMECLIPVAAGAHASVPHHKGKLFGGGKNLSCMHEKSFREIDSEKLF
jgi:hypothetical protein